MGVSSPFLLNFLIGEKMRSQLDDVQNLPPEVLLIIEQRIAPFAFVYDDYAKCREFVSIALDLSSAHFADNSIITSKHREVLASIIIKDPFFNRYFNKTPFHASFRKMFGFKYSSIAALFITHPEYRGDDQITAQDLSEMAKTHQNNHLNNLYEEMMSSGKLAQTSEFANGAIDGAVLASLPHFIARLIFTISGNQNFAIASKEVTAHVYLFWSSGILANISRGSLELFFKAVDKIGLDHTWKQAIHGAVDQTLSDLMLSTQSFWAITGRIAGALAGSVLTQFCADEIGLAELPKPSGN